MSNKNALPRYAESFGSRYKGLGELGIGIGFVTCRDSVVTSAFFFGSPGTVEGNLYYMRWRFALRARYAGVRRGTQNWHCQRGTQRVGRIGRLIAQSIALGLLSMDPSIKTLNSHFSWSFWPIKVLPKYLLIFDSAFLLLSVQTVSLKLCTKFQPD